MRVRLTPLLIVVVLALLATGCSRGSDGDPPSGDGGTATAVAAASAQTTRATAQRSAAYVASATRWRARTLAPVVAQVRAARFSGLVVIGRSETRAESARQVARCAAVKRARAAVTALRPPVLTGAGSRRATRISAALTSSTAAYRAKVVDALGQVATYCTYYDTAVQNDLARAAFDAAVEAESIPFGPACDTEAGCVPAEAAARARYASAWRTSNVVLEEKALRIEAGVTVPCRFRAYRRLCALAASQVPALIAAEKRIFGVLAGPPDAFALDAAYGARTVASTAAYGARDALFVELFPSVDLEADGARTRNEVRLLRAYEGAASRAALPPAPAAVR